MHNLWISTTILLLPEIQGLYSLSGKAYYRQVSWCFEAARWDVIMIKSLWNWTGISQVQLPRYLQLLERLENCKPGSRDFMTSRDLAVRRPPNKWMEAQGALNTSSGLHCWYKCSQRVQRNVAYEVRARVSLMGKSSNNNQHCLG